MSFQSTDNLCDASILKVEGIQSIHMRRNVVHPTHTLVCVKTRATENALSDRFKAICNAASIIAFMDDNVLSGSARSERGNRF